MPAWRDPIERFMEKVDITEDGCWLWNASVGTHGYGAFSLDGETITAPEAAFRLFKQSYIPPGEIVRHTCHIKLCANPDHVISGTYQDNADDDIGRMVRGRPSRIADRIIISVFEAYVLSDKSEREISSELGLHFTTVYDVLHGRTRNKLRLEFEEIHGPIQIR